LLERIEDSETAAEFTRLMA